MLLVHAGIKQLVYIIMYMYVSYVLMTFSLSLSQFITTIMEPFNRGHTGTCTCNKHKCCHSLEVHVH